jgi:PKD repeat protein
MSEFEMLPNPGEPGSPLTIPRTVADPEDPGRPFRYVLSYSPPGEEGVYQFYVAPYDESTATEGTPSPILTLPDGDPPTAALTAAPLYGNPPLHVAFDASGSFAAEGEIVDYAWDFYGSGFFSTHTDIPHTDSTYTGSGTYTASVRVQDSQGLTDTASVEITTNTPPVAVVTAVPDHPVVVPLIACFSAAESSDPDGEIVQYDWDWEDDGIYDSIDAGPEPAVEFWHTAPAEQTARVMVTDDNGLSDTATATIVGLYGEWDIQVLDSAGADAGEGCSLAEIAGVPVIAYYHMGFQCLTLIRASDGLGTGTWYPPQNLTPAGPPDEGRYPSLADIHGNPAIAYVDVGLSAVQYMRATHPSGSEWGALPVTVYPDPAFDTSLCQVEGRPAVAYRTEDHDVFYQRATDDFGATWSALPREVDFSGLDLWNPRLKVIGDTPGITYMRTAAPGKNILMYVHATDTAGANLWNEPVVAYGHAFDSTGVLGSLAEVAGNPALTFNRCPTTFVEGVPVFVRSASPTGETGTWSVALPVDLSDDPHVGSVITSLAVINNLPHVVYYDANHGSLWHVWGTDPLGGEWLEPTLIDDGGGINNVGAFCSLANINGHPAVAYQDETAGVLKYAVLR